MARFFNNRSRKVGLPPGSAIYTGKKQDNVSSMELLSYSAEAVEEKKNAHISDFLMLPDNRTNWINLNGVHDVEQVQAICDHFEVHPLLMEDILNTDQRPKLDVHDNHIYVVLKMVEYLPDLAEIKMEQVSFIIGKNLVLSFQEVVGDTFNPVRDRIHSRGKICTRGAEYLLYALIDTVVDNYFVALEKIGDEMELMEEDLLQNPDNESVQDIYNLKREMLALRRAIWPLREVIAQIEREDTRLVTKATKLYYRDLYDHMIQVIDTIETYRDLLSGMVDLYQSTISNRMNSIMKVLTIISTVFIPITFLTGVYGMNFKYMPGISNENGFWVITGVVLLSMAGMLSYFKKQGWFD
ncbi:magnesium/cobalt transporter CorA [Peijinzhouia sedimentorum]